MILRWDNDIIEEEGVLDFFKLHKLYSEKSPRMREDEEPD
jgi:hypothetical protein